MRSSRLVSMLLLLQLRGRASAPSIAREFEVSVRTVYRDVDALSAAGVPIYADRGRLGGIALHAGYRAPVATLSLGEARALPLVGLASVARDLGLGSHALSARRKLLTGLPPDSGAGAQRVAERFHLDPLPWYHHAELPECLSALADAVWHGQRVRIDYDSWSDEVQREVSPLGLVLKGGQWRVSRTQAADLWCCTEDGSWPPEAGLQEQASNHPVLLRSKGAVVSDRAKVIPSGVAGTY